MGNDCWYYRAQYAGMTKVCMRQSIVECGRIPEAAREELETYLNEDLRGAVVTTTVPVVDEDGKIFFSEIVLRLEDGREVVIEAEMRGKWPMLVLEVNTGRGWRNISVAEDYTEELEELTAAPWHPEPDTLEEARL